jgi:hypothetical protein
VQGKAENLRSYWRECSRFCFDEVSSKPGLSQGSALSCVALSKPPTSLNFSFLLC